MKAINNIFTEKKLAAFTPFLIAVFFSCGNGSEILDTTDVQNVNSVSASNAFFSEGSEITNNVFRGLTNSQYAGARAAGQLLPNLAKFDGRLTCAQITITRTGTLGAPSGTIEIDFGQGSGCVDSTGVARRGKIIITYTGKKWAVGSHVEISLQNFYRNYVHIEGTLHDSITQASDTTHLQFFSRLDSGKITFGDGKFVTRTDSLERTWVRSLIRDNNEWITSGQAIEQNKNGAIYQLRFVNLVYRVGCFKEKIFIPVKGTEDILVYSTGYKAYQIDFGDGTCDDAITVTVGSKVKTINVSADGN